MKKKDQKEYATGIALIVGGTVGVVASIHTMRREAKKREQIRQERDAQLKAISTAKHVVLEKLHAGKYDHNLMLVMEDFNFELIAARYEDE